MSREQHQRAKEIVPILWQLGRLPYARLLSISTAPKSGTAEGGPRLGSKLVP